MLRGEPGGSLKGGVVPMRTRPGGSLKIQDPDDDCDEGFEADFSVLTQDVQNVKDSDGKVGRVASPQESSMIKVTFNDLIKYHPGTFSPPL